ncbi:MAG: GNAT family N-acetyltransferase [Rouxiella aceris]|uniref:GNAT family N-acetyltransferase n=1 Tax=Rouxiella aceris TaxID=2703884 RepID=UPI00283CD0E8|nr:GNAT family N-acetyltransferase [Rouxiella aceris]MDR3434315.1 GNAT family N-acetyltransferase [Rouxiella aceris]
MMKIETNRLVIRHFVDKDAPGLFDYLSSPRVSCFMDEKLHSLDEAIIEVKKRSNDETQFAVCLKETDEIIGDLFAENSDKEDCCTYGVGWHFNKKYEGKGYARESAAAFFDFLFNRKKARRIYAYVEDNNIRSQKLCQSLTMRQEAYFMEFVCFKPDLNDDEEKYENTYVYAILKKEWHK